MIPGELVGSYRLGAPLGQGASGIVYRGEHVMLGRAAAIKILVPQDHLALARFLDEARTLARIVHPGLVQIFDGGRLPDGGAFLAMELLEGELLSDRLRRLGRLPLDEALELMRQLADALEVVHDAGIVHRDIKPSNLFVIEERGQPRCKLLDFGIAKHAGRSRTEPGAVLGTPFYMAPEQCRGEPNLDRRADVYALGAVLFELACGRPPFVKETVADVIQAHLQERPPLVTEIDPALPPSLAAIVARALQKSPEDRFSCALAFASALAEVVPERPPEPGTDRMPLLRTPTLPLPEVLIPPALPKTRPVRQIAAPLMRPTVVTPPVTRRWVLPAALSALGLATALVAFLVVDPAAPPPPPPAKRAVAIVPAALPSPAPPKLAAPKIAAQRPVRPRRHIIPVVAAPSPAAKPGLLNPFE